MDCSLSEWVARSREKLLDDNQARVGWLRKIALFHWKRCPSAAPVADGVSLVVRTLYSHSLFLIVATTD